MNIKWDSDRYSSDFAFVYNLADGIFNILSPEKGERILDIGCGTGELTSKIRDAGANVLAIDQSPDMIARAGKLYKDIEFRELDATDMSFADEFDAVFSNAALHWISDQEKLTALIYRALKPGGRFVCEFGGKDNCKLVFDTFLGNIAKRGVIRHKQWYNPSIGEYTPLLEKHGFTVLHAYYRERITELGGKDGLKNWMTMFIYPYLNSFSDTEKNEIIDETVESLKPKLYRDGKWYADYFRIGVLAKK